MTATVEKPRPLTIDELPEKAGLANLHFDSRGVYRFRDNLHLPKPSQEPLADFYLLDSGRQFVLFIDRGRKIPMPGSNYFGGTDERPFLVEIRNTLKRVFLNSGEQAFYDALVPPPITYYARRFNTEPVRQGDIWTVPVPFTMDTLAQFIFFLFERNGNIPAVLFSDPSREITDLRRGGMLNRPAIRHIVWERFLGTRHQFFGTLLTLVGQIDHSYYGITMAKGQIIAPDHEPLVTKGPHVVAQTVGLLSPSDAD